MRLATAIRIVALLALSAGALAAPASAQAVNKKVKAACTGDYKRLCPSYKVGTPQLRACMEANSGSISSRCIDALIDTGEIDRKQKSARR
jgi:hypothetical protein